MTRLNKSKRYILKNLADSKMPKIEDNKEIQKLKKNLIKKVLNEVEKQTPKKDMEVLSKYKASKKTTRIPLIFSGCGHCYGELIVDTEVLIPDSYSWKLDIKRNSSTHKLYEEYELAVQTFKESVRNELSDYYELIRNATTYNQVVEVWAEAKEVEDKIVAKTTSLCTISDELKDRIAKAVKNRIA